MNEEDKIKKVEEDKAPNCEEIENSGSDEEIEFSSVCENCAKKEFKKIMILQMLNSNRDLSVERLQEYVDFVFENEKDDEDVK